MKIYSTTEMRKVNRNQIIANGVVVIAAGAILVAAWFISPSGFWGGASGVSFGVIIAVLIERTMKKYQDERFTHILNLSARNGFVFVLFALPWTGALIALNFVDALASVLFIFAFSIAVLYGSGAYYFRK